MSDRKQFFTDVYNKDLWDGDGRSGEGSTVEAAGAIIREIPGLLERIAVRTVLDIPCGDFKWMDHVDLGETDYLGADIVEQMIQDNTAQFARRGRRFEVLDLIMGPLPKVDLILCRDCFIHLTIPMIFSALGSIVASGSTYLLTSNYPWRAYPSNDEIDDLMLGGRRINLEITPFEFPPPLLTIPEAEQLAFAADKSLCLWRVGDLKEPLFSAQRRYTDKQA